jgi:hypothetical protein
MKFKNLLEEILLEQPIDPNDEHGVHGFDDGEFAGDDNVQGLDGENDDEDPDADAHAEGHEDENDAPMPINQRPNDAPPPAKKISRTQQIKDKWLRERPGIPEQQMEDAISFFYDRKDRLKPYKPYGTVDPATGKYHINLPEIAALVERFPDMAGILSSESKVKDLGSYTWEQITFYRQRIYQQAVEIDDENWVQGDYTEDDRIRMALERWKSPYNRIIDDGTLTVYRVECKSESIALGSLEHALYRKYSDKEVVEKLPKEVRDKIQELKDNDQWLWNPWCISRPVGGLYDANLWTNYRPRLGFYFLLDNSRPEWDVYHIVAIGSAKYYNFELSTMGNNTITYNWEQIEELYPGLRGKRNLFPWFGETPRERKELTLDTITFKRGDPYDFAVQSEAVQRTYIENNRYVRDIRCFLTLSFENRKLYIDKTSKEDNEYKQRFTCDDPNDPFGILEILRIQKKPEDLYKYLDGFTLKQRLGIPDGIFAIKKSIIGANWRRWLTDIGTGQTLVSSRNPRMRTNILPKYGIMDLNNGNIIKDIQYEAERPRTYMHTTAKDENGRPKIYIFQKYSYSLGNRQVDPHEYFYFLCLREAFTDKSSEFYLKGNYYDGKEGDQFIQMKINDGEFRKI